MKQTTVNIYMLNIFRSLYSFTYRMVCKHRQKLEDALLSLKKILQTVIKIAKLTIFCDI